MAMLSLASVFYAFATMGLAFSGTPARILIPAAWLFLILRFLAIWFRSRCPRCATRIGHRLTGLARDDERRCPNCSLDLAEGAFYRRSPRR